MMFVPISTKGMLKSYIHHFRLTIKQQLVHNELEFSLADDQCHDGKWGDSVFTDYPLLIPGLRGISHRL